VYPDENAWNIQRYLGVRHGTVDVSRRGHVTKRGIAGNLSAWEVAGVVVASSEEET
jgi:hypothetical protein